MSDKMRVRDGNDGYSYPYTSPDLVVDKNGKSATTKFEELETKIETGSGTSIDDVNTSTDKTWSSSKIDTQFKDIANEKIDSVTFSDNKLTFLANSKTIKTITLPTSTTGSSDALVTTNISGTTLSLTTDKYQTATVVDGIEITLPTVNSFTEIHLFFSTTTDLTMTLPACKWQNGNTPTISANKTYEFIFTYTTEWLGGVIEYV